MARKSKTVYRLEYVLLRVFCLPLQWLPYRLALALAAGLAHTTFTLARGRQQGARRRIRAVFDSDLPSWKVRWIARRAWRNTCFGFVDLLRMPRMRRDWAPARTDHADAIATLKSLAKDGRGYILALPHMGSWEMAAATVRFHDLPLFTIAADQRNPYTTAYINRLRGASGAPLLIRGKRAARDVMRRLKNGEILAILPDLRQRTPGVSVPFLGGDANVADGMGSFARLADVPIVPCYVTRRGWTRHVFHVLTPVYPDRAIDKRADIERMTRAVFEQLETAIRAHPEQWFWFNQRWVLEPLHLTHSPFSSAARSCGPSGVLF